MWSKTKSRIKVLLYETSVLQYCLVNVIPPFHFNCDVSRDLIMKMKLIVHTRIHYITSSQVKCFYLLVFTICLWGEQADRKHFDLGRCSIHNADIYIVCSLFGDSENRNFFFIFDQIVIYNQKANKCNCIYSSN